MQLATTALLSALVLLASSKPVSGCSCNGGDALDHLDKVDVLFLGRAEARHGPPQRSARGFPIQHSVTFSAKAYWKGTAAPTPEVHSVFPGGCGQQFEIGELYLVVARWVAPYGGEPRLGTSLCANNRLVRSADALEALFVRLGPPAWVSKDF